MPGIESSSAVGACHHPTGKGARGQDPPRGPRRRLAPGPPGAIAPGIVWTMFGRIDHRTGPRAFKRCRREVGVERSAHLRQSGRHLRPFEPPTWRRKTPISRTKSRHFAIFAFSRLRLATMCALRLSCSVLAVATVANMRASPGHSWVQGVVRVPLLGPAHNNVRNGVAVIHIVFYFSTSPEFRGGVMGGPMSDPPEWRSEMAAKKRKAAAKRKPAAKKRKTAKKSVAKKAPAKRKKIGRAHV